MPDTPQILTGVVRGDTIQLDRTSGLPDGAHVRVVVETTLEPTPAQRALLERAFGSWAGDDDDYEDFLESVRRGRSGR